MQKNGLQCAFIYVEICITKRMTHGPTKNKGYKSVPLLANQMYNGLHAMDVLDVPG